MLEQE